MRKIRIAQIGINRYSHGPELFYTMKQHPEVFDLVGYALVEDERETCAEKIAQYYEGYPELSLSEILTDPSIEAVAVETDERHLLKYAQLAAEHGKHIHMEKPGSPSLADFERLIDTMRKTKKVFHMGYMYRYNPVISRVIQKAREGEFGHIFSVEAQMSRYDDRKCREWLGAFPGGMMFYLGSNLIDVIMQIQGEPLQVIPCSTATGIGGITTEDLGCAVLRYAAATSLVRTAAVEIDGSERRQIVICAEKCTATVQPIEGYAGKPMTFFAELDEKTIGANGEIQREHTVSAPFERYLTMICSFAAMVRGEKENPYTLDYELSLFRTIMHCCGVPSFESEDAL